MENIQKKFIKFHFTSFILGGMNFLKSNGPEIEKGPNPFFRVTDFSFLATNSADDDSIDNMLTAVIDEEEMKSERVSITWSLVLVVLNSLEEVPSHFLTPSIRNPKVAVDDIVSLHTIYLFVEISILKNYFEKRFIHV